MKKIEIELSGGLGNQLFQYAKFIDMKDNLSKNEFEVFLVEKKLSLEFKARCRCRLSELLELGSGFFVKKSFFRDFLFFLNKKNILKKYALYEDDWWKVKGEFGLESLNFKSDVRVRSLFQKKPSLKSLNIIKKEYLSKEKNKECLFNLDEAYSVIHIRLGDYLTSRVAIEEIGVLPEKYFKVAYEKILEKSKNLYIVTNGSVGEVKKIFGEEFPEERVVNNLNDIDSFCFISGAEFIAIANSTFSLWAAYLSDARKVYCPSKWMISKDIKKDFKGLYFDDWEIISY
ncbi:Glycosyl transferase family 11 [Marinomonas spartinae]|uniref:Glycosyl transferase family 11 n=1 Tax=Marinomonas spartinae TaxID=1792290 RepID=A0A1A8T4W1_9GAMM|nr:alpha-1,2-fucosyltransferase [Marinomonas spartinae]SBS26997.1 Glycosyl transferase family 11 [Marinomonas spartinae]